MSISATEALNQQADRGQVPGNTNHLSQNHHGKGKGETVYLNSKNSCVHVCTMCELCLLGLNSMHGNISSSDYSAELRLDTAWPTSEDMEIVIAIAMVRSLWRMPKEL